MVVPPICRRGLIGYSGQVILNAISITCLGRGDMANKVGPKGQIVIEKAIREQLGIEQGYMAVQTVVGDHVEIRFYPAEHNRSLLGILARPGQPVLSDEELSEARERAWMQVASEDWLEFESNLRAQEANA